MTTVLVTGIGGSIGVDVARSLRRDASVRIVGVDANPWGLRQTAHLCDIAAAVPRADREPRGYLEALERLIREHEVAFAFVNPDPELEAMAELGASLSCPTTMPPVATVGVCLDKAQTVAKVGDAALFPATRDVAEPDDVERAFLELGAPLWIRSSIGPGGRGSLVVETAEEAHAWMRYWNRRGRGYKWVLHEYLPGLNANWTGLYARGELVASAAMERVRYFLGDAAASGVSGQVSQCATLDPAPYRAVSDAVVRGLDAEPHGIYSVDLRHDAAGAPRVTEVNPRLAGRPWLYANAGVNMALASLRALTGADLGDAVSRDGLIPGLHLYRQLDVDPVIARPEELSS